MYTTGRAQAGTTLLLTSTNFLLGLTQLEKITRLLRTPVWSKSSRDTSSSKATVWTYVCSIWRFHPAPWFPSRPLRGAPAQGTSGADPGFFKKGGGILGLQAKKGGGASLGPMLKSLHRGPKGGSGPPAPPGSATEHPVTPLHDCYYKQVWFQ